MIDIDETYQVQTSESYSYIDVTDHTDNIINRGGENYGVEASRMLLCY